MNIKKILGKVVMTGAVLLAPVVGLSGNTIAKSVDGTLCANHKCRFDNEPIETNFFNMGNYPSNGHIFQVNSVQASTGFNGVLEPSNMPLASTAVSSGWQGQ